MFRNVMRQLLLVVFLSHSYCSFSNAQVVNTNPTQNTQDLLEPNASNWSGQYGVGMWHGFGGPTQTDYQVTLGLFGVVVQILLVQPLQSIKH